MAAVFVGMLQNSTCCPYTVGDASVPGCCPWGFTCYQGGYCRGYLYSRPIPPQTECGPCGTFLLLLDVYLLAHKCQLSSKDQAHYTDTTATLQATRPHYISKCSVESHHKKVVSCGCGVGVVCLVFGGRCLARLSVHELLQMQRHPSMASTFGRSLPVIADLVILIVILIIIGIPSPTHSFTLGLNPSFSANPPYPSLYFFSFRFYYMDYPDCLLLRLSISIFLLFSFSVFTHF